MNLSWIMLLTAKKKNAYQYYRKDLKCRSLIAVDATTSATSLTSLPTQMSRKN